MKKSKVIGHYPPPKNVEPPKVPPPAPPPGREHRKDIYVHIGGNGISLEPIGTHEDDPFEKENKS